MSSPVRLASFCRLCLSKTKDRVPVFANGNMLDNLLHLIEILIDPEDEPDAVVCYDCVVTLEGFHQFKEQCHVNDEFVKTVPAKLECSASSADFGEEEEEEDDEDEENREGRFLEDDGIEEEDHLELSEAEEVFQESPRKSARASKNKKKKKTPRKSPKKTPIRTPGKRRTAVVSRKKKKQMASNKSTIDELQVLAESYPDFFYFEKGARSIYYTIVFYGERYNSALFNARTTYWQCIHRRKHQCPAQVWVSNDYKTFERRFEHTHGKLAEKEGQAFTPHEALPEIFQICKRIVIQKRAKNVKTEESFEDKFQEFAADASEKVDDEDEPVSPKSESESSPSADDTDEEPEVATGSRPKRKITPNARYDVGQTKAKKRLVEPETKPKKQAIEKLKPAAAKSKPQKVEMSKGKNRKPEVEEMDEGELEDDTIVDEVEDDDEEELDLDKIEEECKALNVPKKPPTCPPLDEQLVLADSYPDYFFFEKGPRSVYFTLVYYGERYHSALFTEQYTYWQCQHRRKYKCPAQVAVTNDYKTFERRYEHTHEDLPVKEGQAFTPMEALPDLFESCRKVVLRKRAKRRKLLLDKYKFLQSVKPSTSEQDTKSDAVTVEEMEEVDLEDETIVDEGEDEEEEELDLVKIEEQCKALNVPKKPPIGPPLDEQLVLADSYPDYFFFEKGPRNVYFIMAYYGERYHAPTFTEHYTYWQCRHRRKYKCPAQLVVTNDYKTFERRYEHTHADLPDKTEGVQAFTPMEALPELFEFCRKSVHKKRAKRLKSLVDKYKFLQSVKPSTSEQDDTKSDAVTVFEVQNEEEEYFEDRMEEDEIILKDVEYEELIEVSED